MKKCSTIASSIVQEIHHSERSEESLFIFADPDRFLTSFGMTTKRSSKKLKNGLNLRVDRDMRLVETVDRVGGPAHRREMKVAADVVVLIEKAENSLGVRAGQSKIGEWGEESKAARDGQVFFDDLMQGHEGVVG